MVELFLYQVIYLCKGCEGQLLCLYSSVPDRNVVGAVDALSSHPAAMEIGFPGLITHLLCPSCRTDLGCSSPWKLFMANDSLIGEYKGPDPFPQDEDNFVV